MADPRIALMTRADIEELAELEKQCFVIPWSKNSLEEELNNELARYLVFKEERIQGYIGCWLICDEAHCTNLAVHPDYRRKKVGTMLLTALFYFLEQQGIHCVTLEVRESNIGAQALYRQMGFVVLGVRKKYYSDNQEDALIMWKELDKKGDDGDARL